MAAEHSQQCSAERPEPACFGMDRLLSPWSYEILCDQSCTDFESAYIIVDMSEPQQNERETEGASAGSYNECGRIRLM